MNKNQHRRREKSINPEISNAEIERKWRRYQEELESLEMLESAKAFQAIVVAVSSSGGGGGSQPIVPADPDIVTLITEKNGTDGAEGTFAATITSSTGYIGIIWWDSETPQILGNGVSTEIIPEKINDGTPRDVTFYSCDADGVRTGTIPDINVNNKGIEQVNQRHKGKEKK